MFASDLQTEAETALGVLLSEGLAGQANCPMQDCDQTFNCDACLHLHLVHNYQLRYVDVYGPVHEAWIDFCERHASFSVGMLGS